MKISDKNYLSLIFLFYINLLIYELTRLDLFPCLRLSGSFVFVVFSVIIVSIYYKVKYVYLHYRQIVP